MRFLKKGKLWLLFFLGAFTQLTPELFDSLNNWLLFFGSFHPALIHFPIGFWTATILVLFIGIRLPKLVIEPWLCGGISLSFYSGLLACLSGISLHLSGTYGEEILQHMYVALFFLLNIVIVEHTLFIGLRLKYISFIAIISLVSMFFASHLGGIITHGNIFTSLPWKSEIRMDLDGAYIQKNEIQDKRSVFEAAVYPILDDKCIFCHADQRARANLKMITVESMLVGGISGPAIVEGDAKSSMIINRIQLPEDDPLHMPLNEPYISDEEELFLIWWINEGMNKKVYEMPNEFASFVKSMAE